GQLLDLAFRRGKIVAGRSCHDTRPSHATCPHASGCLLAPASQLGCGECYAIWGLDGMSLPDYGTRPAGYVKGSKTHCRQPDQLCLTGDGTITVSPEPRLTGAPSAKPAHDGQPPLLIVSLITLYEPVVSAPVHVRRLFGEVVAGIRIIRVQPPDNL